MIFGNKIYRNKYDKWVKAHLFSQEERQKQINYNFERTPLISIVVPAYNTPVIYLSELIESVLAQTYTNWELCIADGNSSKEETKNCLKEYSKEKYAIELFDKFNEK